MKVLFLGNSSNIHTVRWVNGLTSKGIEVVLASQHELHKSISKDVKFVPLPFKGPIGYFLNSLKMKHIFSKEKPDIINAHYASGYGTTARLTGFHPTVISVWGSDVYSFPYKSFMHGWWVKGNLMSASTVSSTSLDMKRQTRKVAPKLKDIEVVPFGVDLNKFYKKPNVVHDDKGLIVIGAIKKLMHIYGIDLLLNAFSIVYNRLLISHPDVANRLVLRISGGGPDRAGLTRQAAKLGILDKTTFVGDLPHESVPNELHQLDIYVALSRMESFGVAVIEASACGVPVVVSDAGGLPEVVADGETGYIVKVDDYGSAADMIEKLVLNPELRVKMGDAAVSYVASFYEWGDCVDRMINIYRETILRG